ncbi:hypothetical protein [Rhodococcus tukisamuensis]|uniref:hypothetical protein n=1 Tax=Rhodococcus tukisamuensis TaxID=168276 RepID=UPI0011149072|nr:hypothetical protein [Rhodococcus tukisamuensis]
MRTNPEHELPAYVISALDEDRASRMAALGRGHELATSTKVTAEERRLLSSDGDETDQVPDDRIRSALRGFTERITGSPLPTLDLPLTDLDPAPRAIDNVMWWARTNWFWAGGIQADDQSDGLHFYGHRDYSGDNLISFSVGSWATFELQPERRGPSASGRYYSAPYVELFGNVYGWANLQHCPWACDDKWSKCRLFLRQAAIQFVDDIGTWRLCGENTSSRQLIDLDGTGYGHTEPLPGYQPMPALQFGLPRADRPLIIDLEVRFDIQLEGSSYIAFSPEDNPSGSVITRYFQWPIAPA